MKIKEITKNNEKLSYDCKTCWEIIELSLKKSDQTSKDMAQWKTVSRYRRTSKQPLKIIITAFS